MCEKCRRLQAEVDTLTDELDQVGDVLDQVINFCENVKEKAEPTLSQSSGVPRGQWSRIKGRVDVADAILGSCT